MTTPESSHDFTPRPPLLWAGLVFFAVALSLCWPMLSGQYLAGDDQVIAGYAFREFGASYFKEHGSIPQWNPYLFGGMPFIAAMHGDIFYPTAWLRWLIPTDIGMTLGFFVHLILAGVAMYCLLRALKLSWTAAVVGGVSYELSGILVSMMRNGHDGKLFVSALAPFAFLALLRAIRHGKLSAFGTYALIIGLCMLSPHYQMTYYLLVASGLFTLWLTFWDKERERPKAPVADMGLAAVSVGLGVGIGMIQGLPFLKYIPFSPRVEGGMSSGWEYATSYAMPVEELMTTVLPQFNGVMENYWGGNFFKTHTEYVGAIVIMLAILGLGAAKRRGLLLGFGMIAAIFLLVAFGGHTPFYRLWYEVMPMMQKVRAAGMAFFLVALPICVWAGLGAERLLKGEITSKRLWIVTGSFGMLAVLGLAGALQGVAEGVAASISSGLDPQASGRIMSQVMANAGELRAGSLRLLLVVLIGGGVLVAVQKRLLSGAMAAVAMLLAVWGDNWSLLRRFPEWLPPAAETYADDEIIAAMRQSTMPFRSYDPSGKAGGPATLYQGSWLMADRIPTLFGYHGNESRFFDELFGGKNDWPNQFSPTLLNLYAVRYIVANQDVAQAFPGYHQTLGPVSFKSTTGRQALAGFLFERDSMPKWVRVVPGAVKAPAEQIGPTVVDARFPADRVVLFADTATIDVPAMGAVPEPTAVSASLAKWEPGAMTVALNGTDPKTTYLVVAENWYPGWTATVDGTPAATHRANHAMLSVAIPSGAKEVMLRYETPGYGTGKLITLGSLAGALLLLAAGRLRPRTVDA